MFTAVVSAQDHRVVRRLERVLKDVRLRYRVVAPGELSQVRERDVIYCLGSRLASQLPALPGPTVILVSGAAIVDADMVRVAAQGAVFLRLDDVSGPTVLRAAISAALGTDIDSVSRVLASRDEFSRLAPQIIEQFLRDPQRMQRRRDLQRAFPSLSRERAQAVVHASGFDRAEHLFTALRLATWGLLIDRGLDRGHVEHYLGISDRTTFRRSCYRAGVPTPSGTLDSTKISA